VVGAGPSAAYVVEALLAHRGLQVEISVVERLSTPGGLVRFGVAPDHPATRGVAAGFARTLRRDGVVLHLGVEVGRDIELEDLRASHHAVVVATGAAGGRALGVAGEELPGVHSAVDFVGWYNGHPDHEGRSFDLASERAVVIGNGNVALDVARILVSDVDALRRTDIASAAIEALAASSVREVAVVGRRGPEHAAFTAGELIRLGQTPGVAVSAVAEELEVDAGDPVARFKVDLLKEWAGRRVRADDRRILFRFGLRPARLLGEDRVASLELEGGGREVEVEAGLVLSAIGYRPSAVPGLPAADDGVVPNEDGRVRGMAGVYVAGWLKRGPSGGIGTNKWCARETVAALVADHESGSLPAPTAIAGLSRAAGK